MSDDDQSTRLNARFNNPGALGLSDLGRQYGATASGKFDTGHPFAAFPTKEAGAAAQFALWQNKEHYLGHTLRDAITNWIGPGEHGEAEYISQKTGIPLDQVITDDFLRSPSGIGLMQAQAEYEGANVLTPEEWQRGQDWAYKGKLTLSSGRDTPAPHPAQHELYGAEEAEAGVEGEKEAAEELAGTDFEQTPKESVGNQDNSILSPNKMVQAIRQNYPNVPQFIKASDDQLWKSFIEKYPTGLEQIKAAYPMYTKAIAKDQNKFLQALKEQYFPNDTQDEFMERLNPPQGIGGFWQHFSQQAPQIIPSWYEHMANLAKFPERSIEWLNRTIQALGLDKKPAEGDPDQLSPLTKDLVKGIVDPKVAKEMFAWAQKEAAKGEKYKQQHPMPDPANISNPVQKFGAQLGAKFFGGLGAAPEMAVSFAPGVSAGPALLIGMAYDGVSSEANAREKGLDNAMWFGAEGLSYRALQQWFMYTPRGRMLSALMWGAGGMADQEAQAFLTDPKAALDKAFSQPVNTAADLISTGAVNAFFGGIFSTDPTKISPEAQTALSEAMAARESGDYKTAAQLLDRTMLLLPDMERKAATNNLLAWRNEAIEARPGDAPAELPGQRGFVVLKGALLREGIDFEPTDVPPLTDERIKEFDQKYGEGAHEEFWGNVKIPGLNAPIPGLEIKEPESPTVKEEVPYAIQKLAEVNPKAAEEWKNNPDTDSKQRLLKHLESAEPKWNPKSEYFEGPKPHEGSGPEQRQETGWRPKGSPLTGLKPGRDIRGYPLTYGQRDLISELQRYRDNDEITNEEYERVVGEIHRTRVDQLPEIKKSIQFSEPQYEMHENEGNYTITKNGEFLYGTSNKHTADKFFERLKKKQEARKTGADGVTDQFYYSGIDLDLMWKELLKLGAVVGKSPVGKTVQAMGKGAQELFDPEHKNEARETAGTVIGEQIGGMQRESQRMAQGWYRQQKLEDKLRFGYEKDLRSAFWESHPKAKRMTWFEHHEAGQKTGNPVADRLFQLHDGLMRSLSRWDEAHGFTHKLRDSYIAHILENPEDMDKLEVEVSKRGWGDPNFMHARQIPTIEMLHALGFKLKTYNLEVLDQMRIDQSLLANARANTLDNLAEAGLAIRGDQMKALDQKQRDQLKSQMASQAWRSPRAKAEGDSHEMFWVHKDADFMLHRAFDPVNWWLGYKGVGLNLGPAISGLNWLKQRTVGMNLGWSAYHQLHMLDIGASDSLTTAWAKWKQGKGTLEDLHNALLDLPLGTQSRSLKYNQKLLNWYLGESGDQLRDLSPYEQRVFELHKGGGFTPLISHERQIQFERFLDMKNKEFAADLFLSPGRPIGQKALNMTRSALSLAYGILSLRPYQKWLFGRAIPSMKMYAYDKAALALMDAHPEFARPQYLLQRNTALRKIEKQVDARFGEQNLRQSFTEPHIKAFGQAMMLSYSWFKSFIDVYGGGLHDLSDLMQGKKSKYPPEKLAYMMIYSAMTFSKNLLISALIGAGVKSIADAFYPNIGADKNGKLERLKPPYWTTTELGGWYNDVQQKGGMSDPLAWLNGSKLFFQNKMQPALSDIGDILNNKDYFGTEISPKWDPGKDFWTNFGEQIWSKVEFEAKARIPFSVQQMLKPGANPRDNFLAIFGMPRAPAYAERSPLENEIVYHYLDNYIPKGKTQRAQDQIDARRSYRTALQNGDTAGAEQAKEQMLKLGMSDKSIENTESTANETEAERLFHGFSADDQRIYLQKMGPDDRRKYLPLAKKAVQDAFNAYP